MTKRDRRNGLDLQLRIVMNGAIVIGPVQAALLEAICNTGSIAAAQRRLGSSYAHVWKLVAAMNATFFPPLVDPIRGGSRGGGAILTRQGHTVLAAFRHLERLARSREVWNCLSSAKLQATLLRNRRRLMAAHERKVCLGYLPWGSESQAHLTRPARATG
jgi:molybdate transport system regulatory protein